MRYGRRSRDPPRRQTRDALAVIQLSAAVTYTEAELVSGLGCTRAWLRRRVGRIVGPYGDSPAYFGEHVLAAMRPFGPRHAPTPVVYFIRCCDAVKIGFASDVTERLAGLQVASPHRLELLATVSGTRESEAGLHRRFSHLRVRGEWFSAVPELLRFIDGLR